MTLRQRELERQREYEHALREIEKKCPQGRDYIVKAENGTTVGTIEYKPQDDTLIITITGEPNIKGTTGSFVLRGDYISSVNKALTDLLSEPEEKANT